MEPVIFGVNAAVFEVKRQPLLIMSQRVSA